MVRKSYALVYNYKKVDFNAGECNGYKYVLLVFFLLSSFLFNRFSCSSLTSLFLLRIFSFYVLRDLNFTSLRLLFIFLYLIFTSFNFTQFTSLYLLFIFSFHIFLFISIYSLQFTLRTFHLTLNFISHHFHLRRFAF